MNPKHRAYRLAAGSLQVTCRDITRGLGFTRVLFKAGGAHTPGNTLDPEP